MQMSGNTMLITGGGSGIGRAIAEEFAVLGNTVIIAGRRKEALDAVAREKPSVKTAVLDVQNPDTLKSFVQQIGTQYPKLNVVIHMAGIMKPEKLAEATDDMSVVESTVETNLLAPMRLTAALLPLLKQQEHATLMTVSSGLAFVPMAMTPTYCATKAAIHSWSQSLRYQLRDTSVEVVELIPPYVQTELMGAHQQSDPNAMPLKDYVAEVMTILKTQPKVTEVCVQRVHPLRYAAESGQEKYEAFFEQLNGAAAAHAR